MLETIRRFATREPLRVAMAIFVALALIYQGIRSGLNIDQIIQIVGAWLAAEYGRSKVTPVNDPRLEK